MAKDAGLGRESLYKALARGAKPRFETVMKVARALGVKFTAQRCVALPNPSLKQSADGRVPA